MDTEYVQGQSRIREIRPSGIAGGGSGKRGNESLIAVWWETNQINHRIPTLAQPGHIPTIGHGSDE